MSTRRVYELAAMGPCGISKSTLPRLCKDIDAQVFGQNDEWQTASSYLQVAAFVQIGHEEADPIPSIATQAA